jgi:uncharacterized membrane protein YdbT with pleckstrin-like domain
MVSQTKYKTSRISFFYNYILALLLTLFLIFVYSLDLTLTIQRISLFVCIPLIAILISEPEFERTYRYYLLEEENVIMVEGIFSKKKLSIPYDQIAGTTVSKSLLGRILKFGDVKISGFKDEIVMKGMKNPDILHQKIQEKINSTKKKKSR